MPGDGVLRLQDEREPGQRGWWPPRMLETGWVERNADRFDVFHVQFGFDGRHPDQLRELCGLLRRLGKPLVYTVHDLRNPNHEGHELHEEQLRVLVEAADALITLTEQAASQIAARFERLALVVPHPHVVPLDLLGRLGRRGSSRPRTTPVVGVHLKSLRANMSGVPVVQALAGLEPEVRLRVDVHEEIWDHQAPGFRADLRCLLEHLQSRDAVDLRVHPYFDDLELYEYLGSLDVAVLPYKFGTHSGWLEACRDLGTAVVAPSCGCYEGQGDVVSYEIDEDGLDADGLREAVELALHATDAGLIDGLGAEFRRQQRQEIARAHRDLYERLLGGRREGRRRLRVAALPEEAAG
jgi:glycosyltransferase involved in cell wall biosynthesis